MSKHRFDLITANLSHYTTHYSTNTIKEKNNNKNGSFNLKTKKIFLIVFAFPFGLKDMMKKRYLLYNVFVFVFVFLRLRAVKVDQFLQNKNLSFQKHNVVGRFLKKLVGFHICIFGGNQVLQGLQLVGD